MELILFETAAAPEPSPERVLAPAELRTYLSLKSASRRKEYLLGRMLLKAALTRGDYRRVRDFEMISTHMTPEGKPATAGAEFSLSHDGGAILLALGGQPVGADVESVQEFDGPMLRLSFDEKTLRSIARSRRPDRAATLAWCLKEAAAKAAGTGVLPLLGEPAPSGLFYRSGFLRTAGRERAYAVCSPRPLPPLSVSLALPRFERAFSALAA